MLNKNLFTVAALALMLGGCASNDSKESEKQQAQTRSPEIRSVAPGALQTVRRSSTDEAAQEVDAEDEANKDSAEADDSAD